MSISGCFSISMFSTGRLNGVIDLQESLKKHGGLLAPHLESRIRSVKWCLREKIASCSGACTRTYVSAAHVIHLVLLEEGRWPPLRASSGSRGGALTHSVHSESHVRMCCDGRVVKALTSTPYSNCASAERGASESFSFRLGHLEKTLRV